MCSIETTKAEAPRASLEELEREICELAAHIAAATCRWLELVAEFDERGGCARGGVPGRCFGGDGAGRAGAVRWGGGTPDLCELVVHVDARTLESDEVVERSHVADGPAPAPETARRLGCDAAVVRIVERDGRPLTVGRRTRTIPPALRRALRSRDHGCRFPGCTHERFLHAHHIRHWAKGGLRRSRIWFSCARITIGWCTGGFRVESAGRGAVTFRRPDGRVIAPAAGCGPARGPGLAERQRARGVAVDQKTCRPLSAGDRLDYGLAVEVLMPRAATLVGDGRAVPREHPRPLQAPP